MQGPVLTVAAKTELESLKEQFKEPEDTLVVAPHGLEYWVGFIWETRTVSISIPNERKSHRKVLVVLPKNGFSRSNRPARNRDPRSVHRRHRQPDRRNELKVPSDATQIHDGEFFQIFELGTQ